GCVPPASNLHVLLRHRLLPPSAVGVGVSLHVEPVFAERGASPVRAKSGDEAPGGCPVLTLVGSRNPELGGDTVAVDDRASHPNARLPLIGGLLSDVARECTSPDGRLLRRVSDVNHFVA